MPAPVIAGVKTLEPGEVAVYPPLEEMDETQQVVHRVTASLATQLIHLGYGGSVMTFLAKKGEETRTIYATTDGASILPRGMRLPQNVYPVDVIEGINLAKLTALQGSPNLPAKLDLAFSVGWVPQDTCVFPGTTLTGWANMVQTDAERAAINTAKAAAEPVIPRESLTNADPERAWAVVTKARGIYGLGTDMDMSLKTATKELIEARWTDEQPDEYLRLYARWLIADALVSLNAQDLTGATYPLSRLVDITRPERDAA
jgi:hypothetical protein